MRGAMLPMGMDVLFESISVGLDWQCLRLQHECAPRLHGCLCRILHLHEHDLQMHVSDRSRALASSLMLRLRRAALRYNLVLDCVSIICTLLGSHLQCSRSHFCEPCKCRHGPKWRHQSDSFGHALSVFSTGPTHPSRGFTSAESA